MGIARWYPKGQTQQLVSSSTWDVLVLNGSYLAGRSRITKASAAWKKDAKKKPGSHADRPTYLGFESKPISFEVLCATTDQVDAVNAALAPYIPAPDSGHEVKKHEGKKKGDTETGKKPDPVTISHPSIDHLKGVRYMTIDEVSEWSLQGDGRVKLTVSGESWVGAVKNGAVKVPHTPTRPVRNKRADDARKRGNDGGANPQPADQPGYCAPGLPGS
jgi:hypothetical protein